MPIRAYFLIITPALAAFLWWASWYLQPEPPKVYQTAAQSAAAKAGKPASTTTGAASAQAVSAAPAQAASAAPAQAASAEAAPQTSDIKLVASTAVEDTKPVVQTPKAKKRKVARRKPRDQAPAYAGNPYGNPYGASGYYGYQQPFGFGRW